MGLMVCFGQMLDIGQRKGRRNLVSHWYAVVVKSSCENRHSSKAKLNESQGAVVISALALYLST